jgi:hypothetical protein
MQKDSFKPHGSMGREISVVGMNGPMGGAPSPRMGMMAVGPSAPAARPMPQPSPAAVAVAPSGRGAQISGGKEVPRGAQQVRLASSAPPPLDGGPVDRSASFMPAAPSAMPASEAEMAGSELAAPSAPRPFLQRGQGTMLMRTVLRGIGPDGHPYEAPYDGEFPVGTHSFSVNFAPLT